MNNESLARYEIMSRIRTVRDIRTIVTSPVATGLFGLALLGCMSIIVSIGDVAANIMSHTEWPERFSYAFSSLIHTGFIVQTMIGLALVAGGISCVNSLRKIPVRRIFFMFGSTQQV